MYVNSLPVTEFAAYHESVLLDMAEQPVRIDSLADIQLTLEIPEGETGIVQLANIDGEVFTVSLDRAKQEVIVDRSQSGDISFHDNFADLHVAPYRFGESARIRLVLDVNSVELFLDGGALVMTELVFPGSPFTLLSTRPAPSETEIFSLRSIWATEDVD